MLTMVPGARAPDDVVELPRQADGDVERGATLWPVMPTCRARGKPPLVRDLARGAQLGAEHLEQRVEVPVLLGRHPLAHRHHGPRREQRLHVVVAPGVDDRAPCPWWPRPRCRARAPRDVRGAGGSGRRAAPSPSAPRTRHVMAATRLPPKAGFHATRRPSSTPKPTASPVSPAPIRAATAGRHLAAPAACPARAPPTAASARTSPPAPGPRPPPPRSPPPTRRDLRPTRPARRGRQPGADGHDRPRHGRAMWTASPSSSRATRGRSGSITTATTGAPCAAASGSGAGDGVDIGLGTTVHSAPPSARRRRSARGAVSARHRARPTGAAARPRPPGRRRPPTAHAAAGHVEASVRRPPPSGSPPRPRARAEVGGRHPVDAGRRPRRRALRGGTFTAR